MAKTDEQSSSDSDLAARGAALVQQLVDLIRDRSVRPVLAAVRMLFVGLVIAFIALVAMVVVVIGIFRIFDTDVFSGRVWATDLLVGGIFAAAGAFLLSLSNRARRDRGHS